MTGHALTCLTHLACVYFLDGREHVAGPLAARTLIEMEGLPPPGSLFTQDQARVLVELTNMSTVLPVLPPGEPDSASLPVHPADQTTSFLQTIRDARVWLARGSVIKAEHTLQALADAPLLPDRLWAALLLERGFLAILVNDRRSLGSLADRVAELGWSGESALLRGIEADLAGNLARAVEHFSVAAEACTLEQPPCRALALTLQAQLSNALGDQQLAEHALRTALSITELRGNFVPFLGWSKHGSPIRVLLRSLNLGVTNGWLDTLVSLTGTHNGIVATLAPTTGTLHERANGGQPAARKALTVRELDVLHELARGASYADVAAHLVVSENTVKTHVSSLYSKLGVTRRSDALATARRCELL